MTIPTAKLRDVAAVDRTIVAADRIVAGETYVGLENVTSEGDFSNLGAVAPGELKSAKFRFDRSHLLYGKLRPYLAKIAAPEFAGVCSTDILPIRTGPQLDRRYLLHFLRTPGMVAHAAKLASGANLPRLSPSALAEFEVPLPRIEEQRQIAAVLDAADVLRAKRRRSLAKLDALTQSIFLDLFGDPVANPLGWPVLDLSEVGTLDRGISKHRPRNDPALLQGDWPLIQTGDVASSGGYITEYTSTYSDLGLAQSALWRAGTLCITIAANIAKTGILTFDSCFPDSVVGFTPHEDPSLEYVRHFLNFLQPALEAQAPLSAQRNINLKVLRELHVPFPPVELRRVFSNSVSDVRNLHRNGAVQELQFDSLFASLQQRAFRGEL